MKSCESNVKPLKNVMALRRWEKILEENGPEKIRVYFRLGLDTGMQPAILQQLKWTDLKTEEQGEQLRQTAIYFEVPSRVEWHKPFRKIYLPPDSIKVLDELRRHNPNDIYIFQTRSRHALKNPRPLTIQRITLELKQAAINCGIISPADPFGVITLRKSFGYHHIVHGNWTVHEMMRYLEQRSLKITSQYLDLPVGVPLGCTPRNRGQKIKTGN